MFTILKFIFENRRETVFGEKQRGATLVEYALIVGLISIAAITAMVAIGGDVGSLFQTASDAVDPTQGGDQTS